MRNNLKNSSASPASMGRISSCMVWMMAMMIPLLCEGEPTVQGESHTQPSSLGPSGGPHPRNLMSGTYMMHNMERSSIVGKRVIYGSEVQNRAEFPYMAFLMFWGINMQYFLTCTGSLISNRFVMTAAGCMVYPNATGGAHYSTFELVHVLLGGLTVPAVYQLPTVDEPGEVNITSRDIRPHTGFNPRTGSNDIGLIKLPQAITFTTGIKPIQLPTPGSDFTGKTVQIAGWGATENGTSSVRLRAATTTIRDDCICDWEWNCPALYIKVFDSKKICYGGLGVNSHCVEDLGGPVVYKSSAGEDILVAYLLFSGDNSPDPYCPNHWENPDPPCTSQASTKSPSATSSGPLPTATSRPVSTTPTSKLLNLFGRGASNIQAMLRRWLGYIWPTTGAAGRDQQDLSLRRMSEENGAVGGSVKARMGRQQGGYVCQTKLTSLGLKISAHIDWIQTTMNT